MASHDDNPIPADILADMQAVADILAAGKSVDPELARRIRERSEKAQAELLRQYGVRAIVVDLLREIRDEE